jgi:hypothetical protein
MIAVWKQMEITWPLMQRRFQFIKPLSTQKGISSACSFKEFSESIQKMLSTHRKLVLVVLLCLVALYGRALTIPLDRGDLAFAYAARKLDAGHLLDFYRREYIFAYPPGTLPLCWIALYISPSGSVFYIVHKALISLFDLALALLLYNLVYKTTRSFPVALASAGWILFDPTIWRVSTVLGQIDVIYTTFLMGSLWLLKEQKLTWSAVTLGLAASVKQPAAIFLPAVSAYVVHKNGRRAGLSYFCKAISVFMLIILPFLVSTPKDFVSMYVYLTPSFSQVIHKITPFAAPQTTKLGLWAIIQLIQQKTTINVGWLASIRFLIFITALILPVPLLYRRDYTLGAAYLLPALTFILFSPQVSWHYPALLVPFTVYAIAVERRSPVWLVVLLMPIFVRYIFLTQPWQSFLVVGVIYITMLAAFLISIYLTPHSFWRRGVV